jgi:hypothetical protein
LGKLGNKKLASSILDNQNEKKTSVEGWRKVGQPTQALFRFRYQWLGSKSAKTFVSAGGLVECLTGFRSLFDVPR